jgi:threonine/homoserine/homoserine lactone efflux protein
MVAHASISAIYFASQAISWNGEDRMTITLPPVLASLGLGQALASAPGPVQAVLLAESVRGGVGRGFRAMAGASLTFGSLLVALALGLSVAPPSGPLLRILEVAGGGFLVWMAIDGLRSGHQVDEASVDRRTLPPSARGALAVLINPGAWLFLGTAATSLFAGATEVGGRGSALVAALALTLGLAVGDGTIVLIGGFGLRRASDRVGLWVRRVLALVLAALGVWLIVDGLIG